VESAVQADSRHDQIVSAERGAQGDEESMAPSDADCALEWITTLCAAGLDYRLSRDRRGRWLIHVPRSHSVRARSEIRAYESERVAMSRPSSELFPEPDRQKDLVTLWTAVACAHTLVLFYVWLGPYRHDGWAFRAARADAALIVAGQWWRAATALTLHAGPVHLLGNALFLLFVGREALRALGQGTGLLLMLLGGMAGNVATAYTATPPRYGVGASTLCFAALGMVSLLQTARHYRQWRQGHAVRRRVWVPLAAGIALLGLLGSDPHSDLTAHALGFLAGATLSLPFALRADPVWRSTTGQWLLTALAASLLLASWLRAWLGT
jgi:rhomboid protease GluP